MSLISAILKDEALMVEMDRLLPQTEGFTLWWLGQSGFLLQWNGKRVLMDPYLSDALTKKYAGTAKPHTRMSEQVVRPELLKNISVVTSSHNHTDHLDAETLLPVFKNNPDVQFVIPEANRDFVAERLHCEKEYPSGLSDGQSLTLNEFTFYGIAASHNEIERDHQGNCRYMGYVIKFANYTIYHSGDTLWFDGMVDILKPFAVDVALLPINGNDPARQVAGNLNCREAAELGKAIGAKFVVPCHYDMFTFNTADVSDFVVESHKINQRYCILQGGGHFNYSK